MALLQAEHAAGRQIDGAAATRRTDRSANHKVAIAIPATTPLSASPSCTAENSLPEMGDRASETDDRAELHVKPGLTDDLTDRGSRFIARFDYTVIKNWPDFDNRVQV